MYQLAIENFALPGDKNFALGGIVTNPANRGESGKTLIPTDFHEEAFFQNSHWFFLLVSKKDTMRQYLTQLRQEIGLRVVERVYKRDQKQPDKW